MSHKPAARVGDATSCPKDDPVEHKGGKISAGSSNITINGKAAGRVGDAISGCEDGSDDVITEGSGCVTFNGKPAAFLGNATDHGGEITKGSGNVFIGSGGNSIKVGNFGKITFGNFGKIYLGGQASEESPQATGIEEIPPDLTDKLIELLDKVPTIIGGPLKELRVLEQFSQGVARAVKATPRGLNLPKGGVATAGKTGAKKVSSTKANDIFKRPKGVPDNWVQQSAKKGDGIKYLDPKDNRNGTYVRIQRGNPNSKNFSQREDYAAWQKNGQSIDKHGKPIPRQSAESHIPLKDFKFKPELFK
jgi:uncharacterized Zn-binding protein involved in type VI secretion